MVCWTPVQARKGYYEVSYNIPTTRTEIMDFASQEALLILGKEPVCFKLLTKAVAGRELLEKVQEQTGLAVHVGF